MSDDTHSPDQVRRTVCKACIGGLGAVSVAMVGYPVVSFLGPARRIGLDKPVEVPLGDLVEGQVQYADLRGQQVIIAASEDGPLVLSASCPHLGCNVIWDTSDGTFHCPCHGAVFKADGAVISGPVSEPLRSVPFEVKDGKIIIS